MLLILSWIACSIFFSTSAIGASFLAKYSMPLEFMMFYRLLIACTVVLFLMILRKDRILIKKNELVPSILVSMSQLNVWLGAYGAKYLISGFVPCISLLQIFVAELLSALVEKRKMRKNIIVSGILGSLGIIMLCNQQLVGVESINAKNTIIGIIFSILATFAAACGNLLYEKSGTTLLKMPRSTFIFYNCLFAGLFLFLLGICINPVQQLSNPSLFDTKYVSVMSILALTSTVIALFAMYYIIEKQGAVKATYMNFILPIISMAISTVVEGFSWNLIAFAGMTALLYSVWVGIGRAKK